MIFSMVEKYWVSCVGRGDWVGRSVWILVGCPCPPDCNDIVTPCHYFSSSKVVRRYRNTFVNCDCMRASACLSICLSPCLRAFLSACLSVFLSACLPFCLSICLAVCLSVCKCVWWYEKYNLSASQSSFSMMSGQNWTVQKKPKKLREQVATNFL